MTNTRNEDKKPQRPSNPPPKPSPSRPSNPTPFERQEKSIPRVPPTKR